MVKIISSFNSYADVALPDRRYRSGSLFDDQRLSQQQVGGCSEWHSRASHLPHHMDRMGDEYSTDEYDPMYPGDTEPWEPNLTTLKDFQSKWAYNFGRKGI